MNFQCGGGASYNLIAAEANFFFFAHACVRVSSLPLTATILRQAFARKTNRAHEFSLMPFYFKAFWTFLFISGIFQRFFSLDNPSAQRVSIWSHLQTRSIPNTGDQKGVIFQSWPRPPPVEGVRLRFKARWGNFLGPVLPAHPPASPPPLSPASLGEAPLRVS